MTFATIKPTRGNRVHRVNLLLLQEHPEQTLQKKNIKRLNPMASLIILHRTNNTIDKLVIDAKNHLLLE